MSGTSLDTPKDTPLTFVPVDQVTEACLVRIAYPVPTTSARSRSARTTSRRSSCTGRRCG